MNIDVNFMIIVFIGVTASMIFSSIWYFPRIFGDEWMRLANVNPSVAQNVKRRMLITFFANFAVAMTLFTILNWAGASSTLTGAAVGIWIGSGIAGMSLLIPYLWEGRPIRLFLITAGNMILSIIIMCAVMAHLIGTFGTQAP
ncbi:MAG: DUF1761 domain-containing protein [Alphaproteobacteria bacterium]|nr:MAG: DUF1761 domain-containing protein [Alphaproteobacteria bacterium]